MDRPAQHHPRSWPITALTTAGMLAAALAPLAAAGTWLLVTDAEVAADVAADGSLAPLAAALAKAIGRALVDLLAYL
jgi:hypothetical protein